jgi:hypothetical protein
MAMTFTYETKDLKIVQNYRTEQWFVFDLNEGDVISKGFTTEEQAYAEMLTWLTN